MTTVQIDSSIASILHATALMFVAYGGYARIATMSEEVREPRQTIPKAIILTLVLTMLLYMAVAIMPLPTSPPCNFLPPKGFTRNG